MTREEIKNTPEIVDFMLSESVMSESKEILHKRLDEICNLAIQALEQEPKTDVLDKIREEIERKANSGQWSDATIYGMQKSIAIIDKYRKEG